MAKLITAFLCIALLTGCESLKLRNIGKTVTTTGIAYVSGGVVPATTVAVTAMAYDEIIPQEQELQDIQTTQQAVAHVAVKWGEYALIGGLIFFIITTIVAPIITRRQGYNKARAKYKVRIPEDIMKKIKDE